MTESTTGRYDAALDTLEDIGWTVLEADEEDVPEANPFLRLPVDEDDSFDADGNVVRELRVTWRGSAADAQVAFAAQGLVLVIPLTQDEGVATLLPQDTAARDLQRIMRVFAGLRARGYVAEGALAWANTDGWASVRSRGGDAGAVFWTTQNHENCFDRDCDLLLPLPLQWAGDERRLAEALAVCGLGVEVPDSEDVVFYLLPRSDASSASGVCRRTLASTGAG
ncbi:hypothetical protein [Embleya hyalina]|uniref:Uncharacterized protein n=1 Tax=Embleya hyalina TaxID=516124 RepID=A0A401YQS0_9ACTN|nr:hypothetical protein [Embleya hyalina]GCD96959.1 hypothetical protein EHYA_04646 [Embleya hyalina]